MKKVIIALLCLFASACAPKPVDPHLYQPNRYQVMTFNIRTKTFLDFFSNSWNSRKKMVSDIILEFDPDVVGVQECQYAQYKYLKQQLTYYKFVGHGRDDGEKKGEMCGIFYRFSRFELLDEGRFWISKNPERPGSKNWGSIYPRVTTWVHLKDKLDDTEFFVFNTHWSAENGYARSKASEIVPEKIQAIAGDTPYILLGDFNCEPKSYPYVGLMQETIVRDIPAENAYISIHGLDNKTTRHKYSGKTDGGDQIDHILYSEGYFKSQDARINTFNKKGKYPSDHFPVEAIIVK